jgi:ribose-phosphate pyrophosphokinase
MTMELHSPQVHGFFRVPTDHLTAHPEFMGQFAKCDLGNTVIVSPDIGHAKHAAKLARALGLPVAAADKERTADESVAVSEIIGDVAGKDVIVFDDEIATGGSIVAVVSKLREKDVRRIIVACTHGVLCGPAIPRLAALQVDEIVTTNTVPIPPEKRLPNMTVLSVARVFGEAIKRNMLGRSVGDLFAYSDECPPA